MNCPFCGQRELEEFVFRKTLADPATTPYAEVYERSHRVDLSVEYWQHAGGCRAWLLVSRNPSSGEVLAVSMLRSATQ